jgi:hypothetical protein
MKILLAVAAMGEATTGLILLVYPSIVVRLLSGAEVAGTGLAVGRFAGIALFALGMACWPSRRTGADSHRVLRAMWSYSLLVTLYLGYLGVAGQWVGALLWPVIGAHAVLTILLARAWFASG